MNILHAYRDDGPLGRPLGSLLHPLASHGLLLALLGAILLVGALVLSHVTADVVVGAALVVAVPLLAAGRQVSEEVRLRWLMPPLLRTCEYGWIIALAAADGSAAGAFALLAVLVFRHYDVVYRIRHQGVAPPQWIEALAGGWPIRMIAIYGMAVAGVMGGGLLILAILLAVPLVAESAQSWRHVERAVPDDDYAEEEIA
jgi:hypothetical protein